MYAVEVKPYMTMNSSMGHFLKLFAKKGKETTNRRNANINIVRGLMDVESLSRREPTTGSESVSSSLFYIFIPAIVLTDIDEVTRSELIQALVMDSFQRNSNQLFSLATQANPREIPYGTFFLSLGLSLGLLVYGKQSDLKKMKKEAADMMRDIAEKIQGIRLYRGKQKVRDVFQFGDLIRALAKIK
jgi:hypothetical protein